MFTENALMARMLLWWSLDVIFFLFFVHILLLESLFFFLFSSHIHRRMHAFTHSGLFNRMNHNVIGLYRIWIFENVSSVLKKNLFSLQRLNACWCWISLQCTLTCERNRIAAFESTGRRDHRWGRRMRKWKRDGLVRKYKNRMHFYASTCWKCL